MTHCSFSFPFLLGESQKSDVVLRIGSGLGVKDQGHCILLCLHSRRNEISIAHKITIIDAKRNNVEDKGRRRDADRSHQMIVLSSGMTTSKSLQTICNKKKRTLRIPLDHHCWLTRSAFSFWRLKTSANKDQKRRKKRGTLFCTETHQASFPSRQKAHGPAMTGRFTWNDTH